MRFSWKAVSLGMPMVNCAPLGLISSVSSSVYKTKEVLMIGFCWDMNQFEFNCA